MNVPAELTTMVMIEDEKNETVLAQRRRLSWKGLSFPGGHLEDGESFVDCAIREVKEETGLTIKNLSLCGTVNWFHTDTKKRYIVMLYKTSDFSGRMLSTTDEGAVFWIKKNKVLSDSDLAPHFAQYFQIFNNEDILEGFGLYNQDGTDELKLLKK